MLQIKDLTFDAYGRRFFDEASVSLPVGAKVGLVGRNGAGKTTLFKLIKGELHAGGGEIGMPRRARMASVDQEHPATPISLMDTILAADEERAKLLADLETAPPEHIGEIYARLFEIDAWLNWGTPDDLRTFEYWQSCFHKWREHPYRLERDRHVTPRALPQLEARYAAIMPELPGARP